MAAAAERYSDRVGFGVGTSPSSEDTWAQQAVNGNEDQHPDDFDEDDNPRGSNAAARPRTRGSVRSSATAESASRRTSTDRLHSKSSDRLRHASKERPKVRRKTSRGAVTVMDEALEEDEENKWIHRDKLAKIESKELAQMGYRISRSSSRVRSKKAASVRTDNDTATQDEDLPDLPEDARQSIIAQEAAANLNNDPETPTAGSFKRPGSSRIPVANDSPHQRTRSRSGSLGRPRAASQSHPSENGMSSSPPKAGSKTPPSYKARSPGSIENKTSKTVPGAHKENRPKTRDGPITPPARPEGDPPWMVNSYKPDPRLPPDQQMLPTHAKRLAQQQAAAAQAEADARNGSKLGNPPDPNAEFILLDDSAGSSDSDHHKSQQYPDRADSLQNMDSSKQQQQQTTTHLAPQQQQQRPGWPLQASQSQEALAKQQQELAAAAVAADAYSNPRSAPSPTKATYSGSAQDFSNPRSAPSPQQQQGQFQQPGSPRASLQQPSAPFAAGHQRNGTEGSATTHAGYNLMPTIHTPPQTQQGTFAASHQNSPEKDVSRNASTRLSQSPNLGSLSKAQLDANTASAPVNQPVRLQPDDDEKRANKEGGCLKGCCLVM